MIGNERHVDEEADPFSRQEEEEVEEEVDNVLRENQRVKSITLIDRVLEVRLEFVESNHMEDGKEDQEGIQDQGNNVGEGGEREGHSVVSGQSVS